MTLAGFWNHSNISVFPFLHQFWSIAFFNLSFFLMDRKTFLSMGIKPKGAQMLRTRFFCQKIEPRGCREMKENFIKLSIFCILYFSTSSKIAQKALLKVCPPELVTKNPLLSKWFFAVLRSPKPFIVKSFAQFRSWLWTTKAGSCPSMTSSSRRACFTLEDSFRHSCCSSSDLWQSKFILLLLSMCRAYNYMPWDMWCPMLLWDLWSYDVYEVVHSVV